MVKKTSMAFLILASFFFMSFSACAGEVVADSKITAVTVYPGQALVTRSATVSLPAGSGQILFKDIIPEIDENSLRVTGAGSAKVKLFGAQLKREFSAEVVSEKAKALEADIQDHEDQKASLLGEQQVILQEREFLNSLLFFGQKQLPKDLVTKMPTVKEVGDLLGYASAELKKNVAGFRAGELKIRQIDKQLSVLRRELAEISRGQKTRRVIAVDVEAPAPASFEVTISYLVRGASWRPVYDGRAAFDKGAVDLVTYGLVKQVTGEDWADVAVTLSTSRPSVGGKMPDVTPWILRFVPPRIERAMKASIGAIGDQFAPMLQKAGAALRAESDEYAAAPQELTEEAGEVYAQMGESGTGVTYTIARLSTVKADGTEYRLPVGAVALKSEFKYVSYPQAAPYAYLNTTVRNDADMQLPAGLMNIFLDGDFVGRSSLDNVSPGETFDLYLGIDENVKVKKERLEHKTDDTLVGGIPSSSMKRTSTYRITVENYKQKNIRIFVFDAMPVPEDDRIKVKILSVKPEPKEKDWEKRKGVWRWEFDLKPREKAEILYTFMVEHPRNTPVEGL